MSTDTTATSAATVRTIALAGGPGEAARITAYRARIDKIRVGYRRRARRNGFAANGVSLLLVAAGAAVGLSPLLPDSHLNLTAVLGVAVILLEGVTRVLRPALRAARARKVSRLLDREFRLYDAGGGRTYRAGGVEADAAFVAAVERILEQADAAEEHDETGTSADPPAPTPSRKAS